MKQDYRKQKIEDFIWNLVYYGVGLGSGLILGNKICQENHTLDTKDVKEYKIPAQKRSTVYKI